MTKTSSFCSINQGNKCISCLQLNLIIWTYFHSFTVNQDKPQNESIFRISGECRLCDFGQNLKMTKTSSFCSFIKKTNVYHVCNWIWSFGLIFTILQWMKTNFKISQLSGFLLRPCNTILVKIWKWLKLLNSVPFIKKTHANHFYNQIWSYFTDFHSFTVNEDKLQN